MTASVWIEARVSALFICTSKNLTNIKQTMNILLFCLEATARVQQDRHSERVTTVSWGRSCDSLRGPEDIGSVRLRCSAATLNHQCLDWAPGFSSSLRINDSQWSGSFIFMEPVSVWGLWTLVVGDTPLGVEASVRDKRFIRSARCDFGTLWS